MVYDCAYIEEDKINKKTNILEVFLIVIEISIFIFQWKMMHLIVLKIPVGFVDKVEILLHLPNNLL